MCIFSRSPSRNKFSSFTQAFTSYTTYTAPKRSGAAELVPQCKKCKKCRRYQILFMAKTYRYRLQPYAGSRRNRYPCPSCGKPHKFTRYEDTATGELLPEQFGSCDRKSNCGYSLNPYDRGASGVSYAQAIYEARPATFVAPRNRPVPAPVPPLCVVPDGVVQKSLGHYEQNTFARLLQRHFGLGVAADLLCRFEVGTSAHWPGATVFWQRDELNRVRGGQVVLFEANGHTAKRPGTDGTPERCTTWVHTALARLYRQRRKPQPAWLTAYLNPAIKKSPSLYGLHQLTTAAKGQPIALVEAPKTAIICTAYFPGFTWLATGALSYLTLDRLQPIKAHPITLYPDASSEGTAYQSWGKKAEALRKAGFEIQISDLLERGATDIQKAAGIDLADLLLDQWAGYPPSWDID